MAMAVSAISTCRASLSASEKTATVSIPMRRAVLMIRQAISPRLAIRMRLNIKRNALCHSRWKWLRIAGYCYNTVLARGYLARHCNKDRRENCHVAQVKNAARPGFDGAQPATERGQRRAAA